MGAISDIQDIIPSQFRQRPLNDDEKLIRDAFVHEYMRDGDPVSACIRCGYDKAYAEEVVKGFMSESYTLRVLATAMELSPTIERQGEIVNMIMNRLFLESGNIFVPAQSRVQAANHLSKMLGSDSPHNAPKLDDNGEIPKGGVMVVPPIGSSEDWEQTSRESQKKLKADVRE